PRRRRRLFPLEDKHADRLQRVTGRLQKSQGDIGHDNLIALMYGNKIKLRGRTSPEIDFCPCVRGELVMAGNEIGVRMRFDDVPDLETMSFRLVEVDADVTLRIDNRGFRSRANEI